MAQDCYAKLLSAETTEEALEETSAYLSQYLQKFLQKQEQVLICFPDEGKKSFGHLAGRAVEACGAKPVFWGPDRRWKELLRLAFSIRAHTVIAHPLVVLGLMKLAQHTATPLYIRNAVLGGYPLANWMVQGIQWGLDCKTWCCYTIRCSPVVVGFSCGQDAGLHVRTDLFHAFTVDRHSSRLHPAERGRLMLVYKKEPSLVYDPEETALLHRQPCACGCAAPRIMEALYTGEGSALRCALEEQLLSWSSVLDYRAKQTESGVDLEIVTFPGELLPKIPSCARLTVRPWAPETDVPLFL